MTTTNLYHLEVQRLTGYLLNKMKILPMVSKAHSYLQHLKWDLFAGPQ